MQYGNCLHCKFKESFAQRYGKGFNHWGEQYGYRYICQRFPPNVVSYKDPYNRETLVKPDDGCYEYQSVGDN